MMEIDPFKIFPKEISDNILQYLGKTDILKASLVSKSWYQFIGSSPICMRKFTIKYGWYMEKRNLTPILESGRRYQNFGFFFRHYEHKLNGKAIRNARSIINKFSSSAVKITTTNDFARISDLPNLKELTIECNWGYHGPRSKYPELKFIKFNGLISKAKNLQTLGMQSRNLAMRLMTHFDQNLKYLENLKILKINSVVHLFGLNYQDYKFRLEEFHYSDDNFFRKVEITFMMHYTSSLKVIKYSYPSNETMDIILTNFPLLHTLIIGTFPDKYGVIKKDAYPVNNNIKTLKVESDSYYDNFSNNMIKLLTALPYLEELYSKYITVEVAQAIFTMDSMKAVKYRYTRNEEGFELLVQQHPQINFSRI